MLTSALARLRYTASIGLGLPFAPWSLDRMLEGLREQHRELGKDGRDTVDLPDGPVLSEEMRRELQLRRFRKQAVRAACETPYYTALFERLGVEPSRLTHDDIGRIPPTSKQALADAPDAFQRRDAAPCYRMTTTGTTGGQTSVTFSADEMRTYAALSAISFLAAGDIDAGDIVQISTSSRATLGNTCFVGACARIGALVSQTGLVEPAHALGQMAARRRISGKKPRVSVLSTYPSYLGELVEEGLRAGYEPTDFGLERVVIGGELLSEGLKTRSERLFGPIRFVESYAMTETWPLCGQRCAQGHLHFEPGQGLVEILDEESAAPVLPGEAGIIVATPFAPYRDTTILLRYDTGDMVRSITESLTCNLRTLQATSNALGKARYAVHHGDGWTYPRDVLEALEALEEIPLPARYGFWAVPGGVAVEVVTRATGAALQHRIERHLEDRGVPVQAVYLLEHTSLLRHPLPLRCDLREATFPQALDASPHRTEGPARPVEAAP